MVQGERTRFWIPQDLAYKGEPGTTKGMLVFDIDLIRIEPGDRHGLRATGPPLRCIEARVV